MLNQEDRKKLLFNTWMRFNSNMGSLYAFFEKATELLDASDRAKVKEISSKLAILLKESPEQVEQDMEIFFPSLDDLDIYPDIRNSDSVKEMYAAFQDSVFKDKILEWEQKHPFKSRKFLEIVYSAFIDPPISGIILRKSMLVTLMTFLEMLYQEMIVNHHLIHGETKEQAIQHAKETEEGWGKRFSYVEKIGLGIRMQSRYKDKIVEMAKRRNLLVHNDGVVDDGYLEKAPQQYKSLKPGTIFIVSTQYFQSAIDIAYTLGFHLCLASWRANGVPDAEQNKQMDAFMIPTLNQRRHKLVLEITKFLNEAEFPRHSYERLLVDRAIAFRELGETKKVSKIISKLRSADDHWSIRVAIAMLANDINSLQRELKSNRVPAIDI